MNRRGFFGTLFGGAVAAANPEPLLSSAAPSWPPPAPLQFPIGYEDMLADIEKRYLEPAIKAIFESMDTDLARLCREPLRVRFDPARLPA